jgi:hypothetical protein
VPDREVLGRTSRWAGDANVLEDVMDSGSDDAERAVEELGDGVDVERSKVPPMRREYDQDQIPWCE